MTIIDRPPLSEDIAGKLRQQLAHLNEGDRMPSVRALMAQYGVSQLTVQQAIKSLKADGLVFAQVGRGTFVGRRSPTASPPPRSVLVLSRLGPRERNEELAQAFHRIFARSGYRSAILSYVDLQHALEIIGGVHRFDACVVQPRLSSLPLQLLASLRARSNSVVIEGYSIVGVDVDLVATDWPRAVELAMRHLLDLGHRRIGFVTQASPLRAFAETARWFRAYHRWAGLATTPDSVILVGPGNEVELFDELYRKLHGAIDNTNRLPFSALIVHPGIFHGENLLASFTTHGVAVPEHMSLVLLGATNMRYEHVDHLAMAGCSTEQTAAAVAATIERRWAAPTEPYRDEYLEPELVIRNSTRPTSVP